MQLYQKIALISVIIITTSVVGVGFTLTYVHEKALQYQVQSNQNTLSHLISLQIETSFKDLLDRIVRIVKAHPNPERLKKQELLGLSRLIYRQWPAISITAFMDKQGEFLHTPVYIEDPHQSPGLSDHPAFTSSQISIFRSHIPYTVVSQKNPIVLSKSYFYKSHQNPRISLAVLVDENVMLVMELLVSPLTLPFLSQDILPAYSRWILTENSGLVVWSQQGEKFPTLPGSKIGSMHPLLSRTKGQLWHGNYMLSDIVIFSNVVPIPMLGWNIIIEAPKQHVFKSVHTTRVNTLVWLIVSSIIALSISLLYSRHLKKRLEIYATGIAQYSQGNMDFKVPEIPADEIGDLGKALNNMASDISEKNKEIQAWNEELTIRVEQRTKELKEAYAQLIAQGRIAAVGHLGAGMAHELNNPLSTVIGNAQMLLMKKAAEEPDRPYLEKIDQAAQRCVSIVSGMLKFSQTQQIEAIPDLDINNLVLQVKDSVIGQAEQLGIAIDLHLDATNPVISGDPSLISQVLLQLISNAFTAMKDHGSIIISTTVENNSLHLQVRDQGAGIHPEIKEKIFDPFYTTKEEWSSVGLGLSIVYRIVVDHGGSCTIDNHEDGGAIVSISLPIENAES